MRLGYLIVALLLAGLAIAPVASARVDRFGADGAAAPSAAYTVPTAPYTFGHFMIW